MQAYFSPHTDRHYCNCLHFRSPADTISFCFYMIVSVCIPVFNFYVFQEVFEYPVTFTFIQFMACCISVLIWNMFIKNDITSNTSVRDRHSFIKKLVAFSIPGIVQGVNTILNNLGLAKTSATLSILIKQTQSVWALLFDLILFKEKPTKLGVLMVCCSITGTVLIAVSALMYQGFDEDKVSAIIMLLFSGLLSAFHTLSVKRVQKWLKTQGLYCHPTETTFFSTLYGSVLMIVVGLFIEKNALPELIRLIPDLKNMVLVTLLVGCAMTAVDKLCQIFLMQRNTLLDWTIIQDSKTVPKIVLDVLINNKYPFDGFSISGGVLILITEITWSIMSPNKKHAGEGAAGTAIKKQNSDDVEGQSLIIQDTTESKTK